MYEQQLSSDPLNPALLSAFGKELSDFLDRQVGLVREVQAEPLLAVARDFTSGGKRLRPAFCYWSYVAAAGLPSDPAPLVRAAASLDLLHVSALVHDDIIDASDTRRGLVSAHRRFEEHHKEASGQGDAAGYGRFAGILAGDLLVVWSAELFDVCGLSAEALNRARPLLWAMRSEVVCGQFLDLGASVGVTGATDPAAELAVAQKVLEFKAARYSVRRPAQIGAALAGSDPRLDDALAQFGSLLGRAFQLRDDVLGVFGDPQVTGKPAGDDLREGKRTVLVLTALQRATQAGRQELASYLASRELDSSQVDAARQIITESGALAELNNTIANDAERAIALLTDTDMTAEGRSALTQLTNRSVHRDH